ncbi:putative C6 transcription factor [Pleurostoma richardsiae]|uniref:C6 transcription factor n=1 Tax=Pleurostoma richardsiae TaxID=41990 RepID=A0AA38SDT4_9PEZI|nr:putative C6 transcription factor [Pleurostoma richardsiae]
MADRSKDPDRPPLKRRRPAKACEPCRNRKENPAHPGNQLRFQLEQSQDTILRLNRSIEELERRLAAASLPEQTQVPPGPADGSSIPKIIPRLRATRDKTKLYGQSHWLHTAEKLQVIGEFGSSIELSWKGAKAEFGETFRNLKSLRRTIKANQSVRLNEPVPDLLGTLPEKSVCDELVGAYFSAVEPVYKVIHYPSFASEYDKFWGEERPHSTRFLMKLVMVLTVGTTFYSRHEDVGRLRQLAQTWIYSAQWWLTGPSARSTNNLFDGLQVSCLLAIAHLTTSLGNSDWISSGALLHRAIGMGLHRDPGMFPMLSIFQKEMRKRLWATVLELTLQAAVDSAMPLLISSDDFDTPLPSNLNDEDIDSQSSNATRARPKEELTDTSIQIVLAKSLPLRITIAKLINGIRETFAYERALKLGAEIVGACHDVAAFFRAQSAATTQGGSLRSTDFHRRLIDLCLRKYMLLLYRPFMIQARRDARFYFARKMCFESCMVMASHARDLNLPTPPSDYMSQLLVRGSGFARGGLSLDVTTTLTMELITQLEEKPASGTLDPAALTGGIPDPLDEMARASRAPVIRSLEHISDQLLQIISLGYPSMKRYGLVAALLSHIKAMEAGQPAHQGLKFSAIAESMKKCQDALVASGAAKTPQESVDTLGPGPLTTASSDDFEFNFADLTFPDTTMGLDPLSLLYFPGLGEASNPDSALWNPTSDPKA